MLLDIFFLGLFGPSVEGTLGPMRFCVFCLIAGLIAPATLSLANNGSPAPLLFGTWCAIAAVLGGYLILFPRGRVLTLILIPFTVTILEIPAVLLLGLWLLVQLYFGPVR
jgi:membrane associated rhomboid family serine protease